MRCMINDPRAGELLAELVPAKEPSMKKFLLCLSAAFTLCAMSYGQAVQSGTIAIWLSGVDPAVQLRKHTQTPADYMDLFRPDAPWAKAASGLTAFKIGGEFGLRSTDDQLRTVIDDLKRRHIHLAVEIGLLVARDRCGRGVEGYAAPHGAEDLAKRIQKFGGRIDYAAMDEPVWFGHVAKGLAKNPEAVTCQDSIPDLADQIAPKVAALREIFPNIEIGDIEAVTGKNPSEIDEVASFAELFQKKTGRPLAFMHADIAWNTNWSPPLGDLADRMHRRGVRFGVICGGGSEGNGPAARTNEQWVRTAIQRCQALAANPGIRPDDLIVQSWEPLPTKMLPETDPGSLTYEVNGVSRRSH
jgi:hypothetical protein